MPVRPIDTLLAIKVLGLVPGLNASDRRVATVLLEHYNRRTSQCDPSLERIAKLLSISRRTVIRSNHKLQAAGLFRKVRHGGHLNRNSYEPNWSRFAEYEAAWREMFKQDARSRVAKLSHAPCKSCHVAADRAVTQTLRINLPKETYSTRHSGEERREGVNIASRSSTAVGNRSAHVARIEAERKWSTDLHKEFGSLPTKYGEIIDAIDHTIQTAATNAELQKRGAGLAYIREKLRLGEKRRDGL